MPPIKTNIFYTNWKTYIMTSMRFTAIIIVNICLVFQLLFNPGQQNFTIIHWIMPQNSQISVFQFILYPQNSLSVSYTHLDVYKRQLPSEIKWRQTSHNHPVRLMVKNIITIGQNESYLPSQTCPIFSIIDFHLFLSVIIFPWSIFPVFKPSS